MNTVVDRDEAAINNANATQPRYRCAPMRRFPISGREELIYFPLSHESAILPVSALRMIRACVRFAPLETHAQAICAQYKLPSDKAAAVEKHLREQVSSGYLIADQDLLNHCRAVPASVAAPPPISVVGLIAGERATVPARTSRDHGSKVEIAVVDDATQDGEPAVTQIGRPERENYCARMAKHTGIELAILEFALLGRSPGARGSAAKNAFLLHSAGNPCMILDGDWDWCMATLPDTTMTGTRFGSELDPTEVWLLERAGAIPSRVLPVQAIAEEHQLLLGRQLSSLVAQSADYSTLDLDDMCPHILSGLYGSHGKVVATFSGCLDDSAFSGEAVARSVRQPTVAHGGPCTSPVMGLDNRDVLPPFLPVCWGAESVFGSIIRKCHKDSYVGYLPSVAMQHHSRPSTTKPGLDASDVLIALIHGCYLPSSLSAADNGLRWLGEHLVDVGELPPLEFEEVVRTHAFQHIAKSIARLEAMLKRETSMPQGWRDGLRQRITHLARTATAGRLCSEDNLCSLVGEFGRLLVHWPDIVEGAKELRRAGVSFGRRAAG